MAAAIEMAPATPAEELSPDGFNFNGQTRTQRRIGYYIKESDPAVARALLEGAGIEIAQLVPRRVRRLKRRRSPKRGDFAAMAEQMAEQLDAGVAIARVCDILGRSSNNEVLAEAILEAAENIRQGSSMTDAFALVVDEKDQPRFPATFINALRIGENGGEVGVMLKTFAEAQLKADSVVARIRSATIYPLVVLGVALVLSLAFMYFVMPKIAEFYVALTPPGEDSALPLPTRIMIGFSSFLWSPLGLAAGVASLVGIVFLFKWLRSASGKDWMARHNIHWPVVGELLRHYHASIILRNISMLAHSGSTMDVMLPEAASSVTNPVYGEMLNDVHEFLLEESTDLATAFAPYGYLMGDEFRAVLLTRENTGDTETLFAKYALVLETRVDRYVERAMKMIEPLMIVGVAIFIGLFVLSVYTPLFQMIGHLSKNH
jgi:type II secretory pathway component PulF